MRPKKAQILLGLALLFGLYLRLRVAMGRADMFWPDEQFQTLEPAAKAVFGYGYMAWEWLEGYRSWFVPLLYMPVVKIGSWLGFQSGLESIHWARSITACFDVAMWWVVARTLLNLGIPFWAVLTALSTQLFFPMPVRWAASTLQDHVLMLCVGFSFPWILNADDGRKASGFNKGLAIGLPFLVKIQSAAWIVVMLALDFFRKGKSKMLLFGAFLSFLGYGLLDWISWGRPYQTLLRQLEDGNKISIFYGTEPASFYFKEFIQVVGTPAMVLMATLVFRIIFFSNVSLKIKELKKGIPESLLTLAAGFIVFFLALTALPHKEFRFLLPWIPVWTAWIAVLLPKAFKADSWFQARSARFQRLMPWVWVGLTLGLLQPLANWALQVPIYLTTTDISELEDRISKDARRKDGVTPCVVLASHNWSWSRGNMILGQKMDYVETRDARPVLETQFQNCSYAIVQAKEVAYFEGTWMGWKALGPAQGFWALLKNGSK